MCQYNQKQETTNITIHNTAMDEEAKKTIEGSDKTGYDIRNASREHEQGETCKIMYIQQNKHKNMNTADPTKHTEV